MKFKRYIKEYAPALASKQGRGIGRPHNWGMGNYEWAGKKCPPDKVWNEATQKCEKALGSKEIRMTIPGKRVPYVGRQY